MFLLWAYCFFSFFPGAVPCLSDLLFGNAITNVPTYRVSVAVPVLDFNRFSSLVHYVIWLKFVPSLHIPVLVYDFGHSF